MRNAVEGLEAVARRDLFPNHSRIKPERQKTFGQGKSLKRSSFKRKRITDDNELEYLNWLHEDEQMNRYTCIVCGSPVQCWHHTKLYSTDKKNHRRLAPLCHIHHTEGSPSPHKTPKLWRELYSMEFQNEIADMVYSDFIKFKEVNNGCLE